MVLNNQSVTINVNNNSIREMECFIDKVCDQLFINETYYGNLLVSMTELLNHIASQEKSPTIDIVYNSDYNKIRFTISPISKEFYFPLLSPVSIENISDDETDKTLFLIHSTVDHISINNNEQLIFEYDISGLHKEIYEERKKHLYKYFEETNKICSSIKN